MKVFDGSLHRIKQDIVKLRRDSRVLQFVYYLKSVFDFRRGISMHLRKLPVIVSLTSVPSRLHTLYLCIETLLSQSLKPDKIILWLDENTLRSGIPKMLQRQQARGLTIEPCRDIGPYKKIIPTLRRYPDALIVTADDDMFYPPDWLLKLYEAYQREPQYIHCYRAHLIEKESARQIKKYLDFFGKDKGVHGPSLWLFPTGVAGVIYPPHVFSGEVFNEDVFFKIVPTSDDIWLKAMSLLNRVPCKKVFPESRLWPYIPGTQAQGLWHKNVMEGQNDVQIKAVFDRYDLYEILD